MDKDFGEKLRDIVRDITESSLALPRWSVGDIVMHPEGYPVKIVKGTLWREYPDGGQRLENQWVWQRVDGYGETYGGEISGNGWASKSDTRDPSFGH